MHLRAPFASFRSQSAHVDAIVETRSGKMRGSFRSGVITFKGIPYTAPPFGTNRLQG
jgi:para-nitrobenzyl esterase